MQVSGTNSAPRVCLSHRAYVPLRCWTDVKYAGVSRTRQQAILRTKGVLCWVGGMTKQSADRTRTHTALRCLSRGKKTTDSGHDQAICISQKAAKMRQLKLIAVIRTMSHALFLVDYLHGSLTQLIYLSLAAIASQQYSCISFGLKPCIWASYEWLCIQREPIIDANLKTSVGLRRYPVKEHVLCIIP